MSAFALSQVPTGTNASDNQSLDTTQEKSAFFSSQMPPNREKDIVRPF